MSFRNHEAEVSGLAIPESGNSVRSLIGAAVALGLVAIAAAVLTAASLRFPFYYMWDMDHTTVLDTLLIGDGLLPDHINHTGLGMYLWTRAALAAADALGVASPIAMTDLSSSLNPLLPLAGATTFLRLNSPVVALASALTAHVTVCILFRLRPFSLAAVVVLAFFLAQPWLIYQSSLIRTELYAILFWQLALLAVVIGLGRQGPVARTSCYTVAGLFLGLAYLTKFQAFVLTPIFLLLAKSIHEWMKEKGHGCNWSTEYSTVTIFANLASMAAFAIMIGVASHLELASNFFVISNDTTGQVSYGINIVALSFFALGFAAIAAQLAARRWTFVTTVFPSELAAALAAIQWGYVLAPLAGLLIFVSQPAQGLYYSLANFKVAFLRQFRGDEVFRLSRFLRTIGDLTAYDPIPIVLVATGAVVCLIIARSDGAAQRRSLRTISAISFLVLLLFIALFPIVRPTLRDVLWWHAPLNMLAVLSITAASLTLADGYRYRWARAALVPLVIAAVLDVHGVRQHFLRTDLNANIYGWDVRRAGLPVYAGNQVHYYNAIHQRIPKWEVTPGSNGASAFRQALDLSRVMRIVSFVLPNQDVSRTKIGVLEAGHTTSSERRAAIVEMPAELRGATVVDLHGLTPKGIGRLRPRAVSAAVELLDKIAKNSAGELILVVPRSDLSLFLFQAMRNEQPACKLSVTTRSDQGQLTQYCGSLANRYLELDPPGVAETFLVIQPRYAP
jgi:hypothetical protein